MPEPDRGPLIRWPRYVGGPLIRWPRYVGGALDGQDCPNYPPEQTVVKALEPTPYTVPDALPVRPESEAAYGVHIYRRHHVPFAVGDRRITIVAYAAVAAGPEAVAWRILQALVAGLDRLPA